MIILFTVANANLQGGTEILAFHLLHELNVSGVECRLLTMEPYKGDDPMVLSFADEEFRQWSRLAANPLNKLMGCKRSDAYLSLLISQKAELVGAEWIINHTYDICAAIPTNSKWKTAQVFNWSIQGYESSLKRIIHKKGLVGRMLSRLCLNVQKSRWHKSLPDFTRLVMLTDAAHTEVKNVCHAIKDKQLVTIPDPLMQTEDCKMLSSLQNNNVIFVGRLSHEKGVMRLIRIWEKIRMHLSEYSLLIYGVGDIQGEMESFIKEKNIEGVTFKGFCKNLQDIYSNADLLLMTSDSEGFGMVLIEAMYHGVPCFTFDCPVSPKEIIANAGVAIPCFDEETYADEVIKLLCEPERMRQLQSNAIKIASRYYIDKIINKWNALLK